MRNDSFYLILSAYLILRSIIPHNTSLKQTKLSTVKLQSRDLHGLARANQSKLKDLLSTKLISGTTEAEALDWHQSANATFRLYLIRNGFRMQGLKVRSLVKQRLNPQDLLGLKSLLDSITLSRNHRLSKYTTKEELIFNLMRKCDK